MSNENKCHRMSLGNNKIIDLAKNRWYKSFLLHPELRNEDLPSVKQDKKDKKKESRILLLWRNEKEERHLK